MIGKLAEAFARARREHRIAFIPYLMAGDPDLPTTEALLVALSEAGADAIELGIPYSDPLADGPTVASAGARALANETRLADVLEIVRRRVGDCAPLILFSYYNPVYQFGIERFAVEAARAGIAGTIVPDLALEESLELRIALDRHQVDVPLLVAPSTSRQRAVRIAEAASGFVYVVSRLGVTGTAKTPDFTALKAQLGMLHEFTDKPLAVGFGLSRPEEIREIAALAEGIVVGSALIDAYVGTRGEAAAERVRRFVQPLIAAAKA